MSENIFNVQENVLRTPSNQDAGNEPKTANITHEDVPDMSIPNLNATNHSDDTCKHKNQSDISTSVHNKSDLLATAISEEKQATNTMMNTTTIDASIDAKKTSRLSETTLDANKGTTDSPKEEYFAGPISRKTFGLFAYVPKCFRNICLTPCGVLFFLCWASTMQVHLT